jgi:hypothetical protein
VQQLGANPRQVERGDVGDSTGQAERGSDLAIGQGGERGGVRDRGAECEDAAEAGALAAYEGSVVLSTVEPHKQPFGTR